MNNLFFRIDSETPIYLYGAASIGKIVLKGLSSFNIQGFIDMRGKEIQSMCKKPVYSLEDMPSLAEEDDVIIVTVKNVFEHEEIAYSLYLRGCKNIIYKPKGVLEGNATEHEEMLSDLWDEIVSGDDRLMDRRIPQYQPAFRYDFVDYAKIRETDERVIANIPLELIYTNDIDSFWGNINIQALYPHISFFGFLDNKSGTEKESYIEFCEQAASTIGDIKITEAWRENVLRNRTGIYEQMCNALDLDPDFFIRTAPTADWNTKGYFNLTSGKHRATFLVSKGKRYIPLSIAKPDYLSWLQKEEYIVFKEQFVHDGVRETKSKILHPYFYKFPCVEPIFYTRFQSDILSFLCRKRKLNNQIIKVTTNLNEKNSLYRLLERCIFTEIVSRQGNIQIIDEFSDEAMPDANGESLVIASEVKKGNLLNQYINNGQIVRLYCIGGKP